MARLILSAGMFSALAAVIAPRSRGFFSGSPPFLAAMVISLISRVKILPRLASSAPFLCLMVAHLEWPLMGECLSAGVDRAAPCADAPSRRRSMRDARTSAFGALVQARSGRESVDQLQGPPSSAAAACGQWVPCVPAP